MLKEILPRKALLNDELTEARDRVTTTTLKINATKGGSAYNHCMKRQLCARFNRACREIWGFMPG